LHNLINLRLGKEEFDCLTLDSTYDCGCGDDPLAQNGTSIEGSTLLGESRPGGGLDVREGNLDVGGSIGEELEAVGVVGDRERVDDDVAGPEMNE
jgi:hypothetical protein